MLDALPNPLPAPDQFPGAEATRNKFTVLFPCVPRPEKGGEITRTFVEHAASEFHDLKVISRQFTGVDASEHDFLTYIDDDLGDSACRQMMRDSDLIVIPYLAPQFAYRTSGIIVDAMLARKPVITLQGTWLGDITNRYRFG